MTREVCEHFNPIDLPCAKCEEKRKSEALFLADELEIPLGTVIGSEVHRRAAAELRRLHAELRRLQIDGDARNVHLSERMKDLFKVEAQRDALLEALRLLNIECHQLHHNFKDRHDFVDPCPVVARIKAAIKAAEENT